MLGDAVLKFYDRVAQHPQTDSATRAIVARANHRRGFTRLMRQLPGGVEAYQLAVSQLEKLIADEPKNRNHRESLAYAYDDWSMMTLIAGGFDAAEQLYRRGSAIRKEVIDSFGPTPESMERLVMYELDWARKLDKRGKAVEAAAMGNELETIYKTVASRLPANDPQRRILARSPLSFAMVNLHGDPKTAERAFRLGLSIDPDEPEINNDLAWVLAVRPDSPTYDPTEAVKLVTKTLARNSQNGLFWNTMGVAQYRAGDFAAAKNAFDRSTELRSGGDPNDWFFLAMLAWKDGDKSKAHEWFEKGSEWLTKNPNSDPDLPYFQREAAAMLGIKTQSPAQGASSTDPAAPK
jgi:Flp pilus assembly protein TadD